MENILFTSLNQIKGKACFRIPKKEIWGVSCKTRGKKSKMDVEYHCKSINYCYQNDVFLDMIIDRYSILPDIVIFSDSHEKSWHNRHRFTYAIQRTRFNRDFGPIFGNFYDNYKDKNKEDRYNYQKLYNYVFQKEMPPFNKTISPHPCCCIFYVSKRAILSHSKDFYIGVRDRLRNWSVTTKEKFFRKNLKPPYFCGRLMEYNWHVIFTYNLLNYFNHVYKH